jgi:BRCA1-associated protein
MKIEDFLTFIEKYTPKIDFIRFIYDKETSDNEYEFLRAIIYFQDQDSTDNFYYDFNTKSFPFNKMEYIYSVFINKIDFYLSDTKESNSSSIISYSDYNNIEQTCCPLCLEKVDTTSSGIHTYASLENFVRWTDYKKYCRVCKKLTNKENEKCNKCMSDNNNIWTCLICGFNGCNRYELGHAVEHFKTTLHTYSMDIHDERIWDYLGDLWVHRIIKMNNTKENTNDTIFLDNNIENSNESNINSKEFLTRIENIISEYNFVLSNQLEEQRKFYENEINKLNERHDKILKEKIEIKNVLKDKINKQNMSNDNNKKLIKEFNKKLTHQEKKMKDLEENIILNKELIDNVKIDFKEEDNINNKVKKNIILNIYIYIYIFIIGIYSTT